MKIYITKDLYKEKTKILLMPKIYEQINDCLERTGIVFKNSNFSIRYGSYDILHSFEEITKENIDEYKNKIKTLAKAIKREKEKKEWGSISHKAILMFFDEFEEMCSNLLGVDSNAKNI